MSIRCATPASAALNDYLFGELHFVGNESAYEGSAEQLPERRASTGGPAFRSRRRWLYMEAGAARGSVPWKGLNFLGHFLLRCPAGERRTPSPRI